MISLLTQGQFALFGIILIAIIISLTFHEYGHAATAWFFGDNTAQRQGRMTLNPLAHIDPMGLLMVALIGFGYAKPVPTNPRNFRYPWADMLVSAAGPGMNLLIAIVAVNFYLLGLGQGWAFMQGDGPQVFFIYLAQINLILMLFNLIPIGALDGHYILPYFLPKPLDQHYRAWNHRHGNQLLFMLILLSFFGVNVFGFIWGVGQSMLPLITFVR